MKQKHVWIIDEKRYEESDEAVGAVLKALKSWSRQTELEAERAVAKAKSEYERDGTEGVSEARIRGVSQKDGSWEKSVEVRYMPLIDAEPGICE